jgi:hypothetical protein
VASVPVFGDLGGSCLRVKALEGGIGTFAVVRSDPGCDAVAKQAQGAKAAAEILSAYFSALNAVATGGGAKSEVRDVTALAAQATAAVSASPAAQGAVAAISQFLLVTATGTRKAKDGTKDLDEANRNVSAVTEALAAIVRTNYLDQELADEERKLAVHYKEYAQAHPEGAVVVQLDARWQADQRELAARRTGAESVILALAAIRQGVATVASDRHPGKAGELQRVLKPYTTQIQALVPQLQKAQ